MDQSICASLSHTHYWYEVGVLKVPAVIIALILKIRYPNGRIPQVFQVERIRRCRDLCFVEAG